MPFRFPFPVQFSPHWFSFPLRTSANETLREITLNIYFWDDCSRRLDDKHHYVMYINPPSGYTRTHLRSIVNTYIKQLTHKFKTTNSLSLFSFTVTTFDHLKSISIHPCSLFLHIQYFISRVRSLCIWGEL